MKFSIPSFAVNKQQVEHISGQISRISLLVLAAAIPFLALPISESFVSDTKRILLLVVGLVILGLQGLKIISEKTLKITLSPFCGALAAFGATIVISTILNNTYPVEGLLTTGGVYLAAIFIAGFSHNWLKPQQGSSYVLALAAGGAVLAASSLLQLLGVGPSQLFNAVFGMALPNSSVFNLAESPLIALQALIIIGLGLIGLLLTKRHSEGHAAPSKSVVAGLLAATVVGLAVSVWPILPGRPTQPVLLPLSASWSIAVDMLKSPKTALIGVGPHEFAHAYSQFKPLWVNQTPFWNVEFSQGSNLPLSLLITTGLLGFLSWLWLVSLIVFRIVRKGTLVQPLSLMLVGSIVLQLVLPPHPVTIAIFALTLAYWLADFMDDFEQVKLYTLITRLSKRAHAPTTATTSYTTLSSSLVGLVLLAAAVVGLFGVASNALAANYFYQSTFALKEDDGVRLYELQQRGAKTNPYLDAYRRRYALTNLTVASALANKANLTEVEQQQIVQLVQQAIREARAATILEPDDTRNWLTLGQVYTNLVGTANGAEQWAVSAYVRAIELAPADPELRLAVGSIYYNQQQYDEAAQLFQQAVQLKPNHANAYYNLANALRQLQRLGEAERAYQEVLKLIDPQSADYARAMQELDSLKGQANTLPAATEPTQMPPVDPSIDPTVGATGNIEENPVPTAPSLIEENLGLESSPQP